MHKLAVVALGGNALQRDYQKGTIEEQEWNAFQTLENLMFLIKEGYQLVLTHGNGPQVGDILLKNDAGEAAYNIPQMPLDICVAGTQGEIGYIIERILYNVLNKHGIRKNIITLVSQVVVNHKGESFMHPTKRIGRIYTAETAKELTDKKGWIFKEEQKSSGGLRRVVPSPEPLEVMNKDLIRQLVLQGNIVIAAGGGGIPVYLDENGDLRTTDAVIDKDFASALLGASIGADEFFILTDVPYVYLNYKKPGQQILEFLDYSDTIKYLRQGMFGEGSMKPKIEAALYFLENGGKKSIITEATKLEDKRFGSKITMEYDPADRKHLDNYDAV